MKEYLWQNRFLKELFGTDMAPKNGFEEIYNSTLNVLLLEKDEQIIRLHFEEHRTFEDISDQIQLSRVRTNQRYLNAMDRIRKSEYAMGLLYGIEALELYELLEGRKKELDELKAKSQLLKIFNEMENAENTKISKMKLSPGTKEVFKKVGIDNAEQLLSFSINDFALMAGAVMGDPEASEKFEKLRTTEAYAETLHVSELGFSNRTRNALLRSNINSMGDICKKSYDDLCRVKDLGAVSRDEVISKLHEYNLSLKGENK